MKKIHDVPTRCFLSGLALLAAVLSLPAQEELPLIPQGVSSRAITWENRTGARGAGGQAKGGRKGSPSVPVVKAGETATLMDVQGCGVIRHIWLTVRIFRDEPLYTAEALRNLIIRMYWDGSEVPSVEAPLGDFFGVAHGRTASMANIYTMALLGRGFNSYFPMPFRKQARITITNDLPSKREVRSVYFQIDYELHPSLPANTGYFHALFRRQNPTVQKQDYVLLDTAEGPGFYVGCTLGIRPLEPRWWGEGEMKMYIDGDREFPTICGTGTEDYFLAAWSLTPYQTPYAGCVFALPPDDKASGIRHKLVSLYRFHEKDPVYFEKDLKVTIQQMGLDEEKRKVERSDDVCSVAYWYQARPNAQRPPLPDAAARSEAVLDLKPGEPAVILSTPMVD